MILIACLLCIRSGAQSLDPVDPAGRGRRSVVQIAFLVGDTDTKQIATRTQGAVCGGKVQVSMREVGEA